MKLAELAEKAKDKHEIAKDGIAWMVRQIKALRDDDLWEEVIWTGCNDAFSKARGTDRKEIKYQVPEREPDRTLAAMPVHVCRPGQMTSPKVSIRAKQVMAVSAWLDVFMVGDKRLGDCTREDLLAEVTKADGQLVGWNRRRDFMAALAAKLRDDWKVRDKMTNADVESAWRDIVDGDDQPPRTGPPSDVPKPPAPFRNLSQAFTV